MDGRDEGGLIPDIIHHLVVVGCGGRLVWYPTTISVPVTDRHASVVIRDPSDTYKFWRENPKADDVSYQITSNYHHTNEQESCDVLPRAHHNKTVIRSNVSLLDERIER